MEKSVIVRGHQASTGCDRSCLVYTHTNVGRIQNQPLFSVAHWHFDFGFRGSFIVNNKKIQFLFFLFLSFTVSLLNFFFFYFTISFSLFFIF